jgi:hypothetical protein
MLRDKTLRRDTGSWHPLKQDEVERGTYGNQEDWIAKKTVEQPLGRVRFQILCHSPSFHISSTSTIEIACGRMMCGMSASPACIWREGQHRKNPPEGVVSRSRRKERPMAAVMLNDE